MSTWDLRADTPDALERKLARGGRAAWVTYELGYRYTGRSRGGRCEVDEAEVTLDLSATLPRWRHGPSPSPATARRWTEVRAGLEAHEVVHVRMALGVEHALDGRFVGMDCERSMALFRQVVAIHEGAQSAYDACTDHSRRQARCDVGAIERKLARDVAQALGDGVSRR